MDEITTVKVARRTKEKLARIGTKEDTYDDIIKRLIEFYSQRSKNR